MTDKRKSISEGRGIGVGYVTLIMLFAVICLTVLASLSYQAARANDKLNEKSISFAEGYYSADSNAKKILSELDEGAMLSHETGFFDDSFPAICEEYENVTVRKIPEGYEASFSESVSGNLELSVKIVFFSAASGERRYRIEQWKTVSVGAEEDSLLGVWNGEELS